MTWDFQELHEHGIETVGEFLPFITLACNSRCKYCYMYDFLVNPQCKTEGMEVDFLFGMAEYFCQRQGGIDHITLLGGEPTLHPKITEIVNELSQLPIRELRMTTNGTGLHHMQLNNLRRNAFSHVSFSIDGTSAFANDLNRGQGVFEKIIHTMDQYRDAGIPLSINYTVTKNNINDLLNVADFFAQKGVSIVNFHRASMEGNAYNNQHILVGPAEWIVARDRLLEYIHLNKERFVGIEFRIPYLFLTQDQVSRLNYKPIQEGSYRSPSGGSRLLVFPPTKQGRGLCYMSADMIGHQGAELGHVDSLGTFTWNENENNEFTAYKRIRSSNIATVIKNEVVESNTPGYVRVSHSFVASVCC